MMLGLCFQDGVVEDVVENDLELKDRCHSACFVVLIGFGLEDLSNEEQ